MWQTVVTFSNYAPRVNYNIYELPTPASAAVGVGDHPGGVAAPLTLGDDCIDGSFGVTGKFIFLAGVVGVTEHPGDRTAGVSLLAFCWWCYWCG